MWWGMLDAAAGQVPGVPVEPLSWLAGALAGYIAQLAHWFGAPGWAQADVGLHGVVGLAAGTVLVVMARCRAVVVWRPLPSVSLIAATRSASRPSSRLTRVDFPTPDDPTSAIVCGARRYGASASSPRS